MKQHTVTQYPLKTILKMTFHISKYCFRQGKQSFNYGGSDMETTALSLDSKQSLNGVIAD